MGRKGNFILRTFFIEANGCLFRMHREDFCIDYVEWTGLWLSNIFDCYQYQEMYFTFLSSVYHIHIKIKISGNNIYLNMCCCLVDVLSDSATPWTAALQAPLSFSISLSLLKFMSPPNGLVPIKLVILSNHLILCHPLLLLPSVFSSIRVFCSELVLHFRWPQHWSFSISLSNEYSGLISFRIDWFDLLDVQGTLMSLPQHHNLKASILWCSTFFMVQVSHPYIATEKTIALTMWTFVGKAMS